LLRSLEKVIQLHGKRVITPLPQVALDTVLAVARLPPSPPSALIWIKEMNPSLRSAAAPRVTGRNERLHFGSNLSFGGKGGEVQKRHSRGAVDPAGPESDRALATSRTKVAAVVSADSIIFFICALLRAEIPASLTIR
jgi:hypothetical protein